MEWLTCIKTVIDYIESHLEDDICVDDVAKRVYISPFFLQKGFSFMTGYTVSEYIRSRRLYQAAVDIVGGNDKIIDIAYKYCYETPESFSKAFSRFHGVTPSNIRKNKTQMKVFLPLSINIYINGGNEMNFKITKMSSYKVIGFVRTFTNEEGYREIPKFWGEIKVKHMHNVCAGKAPTNAIEKAIVDNGIGEFGICIDDTCKGKFRYMIGGKYNGGEVPEGMIVYELPEGDWAMFDCVGPMPEALQTLNTKIYKEWLPGNPNFELAGNTTVEWYESGDTQNPNYRSGIWLPVKKI